MAELKINEDILFGGSPFNVIVEKIVVQRAKALDDAILGEINKIINENGHLTVVELNEKAIVEALEKQIPKKPIDDRYPWSICPVCGGSMNLEHIQEHIQNQEVSHCEHCGQKIDWSDTE